MILSSKTFQIFKHAKGENTRITMTIARFYSSWVISRSLFEELSAAAPSTPSAPSGHPQARPPCLMLPAARDKSTGEMVYSFFNPINKKIFKIKKKTDSSPLPNTASCFCSSHGLLAFIDPRDCGLYLSDPFSVSTDALIRLPSIETFPNIVGTSRKSNKNRFIIQFWGDSESDRCHCSAREVSQFIIDKVVSSPAFAFKNNNNNDCLLMAMGGMEGNNLVFCKPGDTTWTALSGPLNPYIHIISSSIKDKVFYAMGCHGKIEAWDLRDLSCIKRTLIDYKRSLCKPKFCQLEEDLRAQFKRSQKIRYLVESSGDLLLVYRYVVDDGVSNNIPSKTIRFDVYKMNFSLEAWTYVNSLGDRALFVGWSNSFSLHVCDYPGLKPNSIYFAHECWYIPNEEYPYGGHDMGVYNLEDSIIEPFYPFGDLKKIEPAPFWVAPNPHSGNAAEWFDC